MKMTVVTAKQFTLINLNVPLNHVQMKTRDLSVITIVKRMKLRNTVGKYITTLAGIRRKLLIGKVG